MACGTPVAAYARGALPEIVTDGAGALALPGDVSDLARAILEARERPGRRPPPRRRAALADPDGRRLRAVLRRSRPHDRLLRPPPGIGHLHRALAGRAPGPGDRAVQPAPSAQWAGDWLQLPADDLGAAPEEATAGGHLHWVPLDDEGVRDRAAALSAWIATSRPALLVADVSVEVALLARLHGVRVVSLVMPGSRGDRAHQLGYGVSSALWAAWPPAARDLARGPARRPTGARLTCVGGVSRFPVRPAGPRRPGPPRVTALLGDGGGQPEAAAWEVARRRRPTGSGPCSGVPWAH